ncbi:flavin reductase family protein [Streptomyces wuyuanensis]|uniref:NADH-FMN oxidoreductase RutF, flavin reductase (DIM6/NTAB) family n=1 Tax=Streptomyces wuyuanensis TaxID=1196353 RepID=A0A1G9TFD7_9ACTN|nr:flavin reductase family protein [Streptomyces wuyuanensis]SDM46214.1 NADH-FMN oxidoreductase RutF, flavin reductase (DIM6/NTAB) family [Streptomyces wuyuanensis]
MPTFSTHPDIPDRDAAEGPSETEEPVVLREADLRPFMAAFPSGVSVVTTIDAGGLPRGLTCSSLASVALTPPTLVVCIRTASPTLQALLAQGQFALNLLHERARGTSDLFASGDPARFERTEWRLPLGASGPHLTASAHAVADCSVVKTAAFGDHTAVFAEAHRVTVRPAAQPLLYGLRRYAEWSAAAATPPPAASPEGAARVRG